MNESFGLESVHFGEDRPVPSTPRALWLLFSRTPEQVTPADADAAEQLASALVPYALESVQAVLAIPDRGEATEEAPDFGHEFGMIVLADRRDWRGFDALLRLLYRSTAWLETVFPSFLVGDGSAIVASFAMGDADRLFELQRLLSDANRPMAYRHLCGSALSKLAFHGALPREELRKIYDAAWDANPGRQFVRFALDPLALSMLGVDWLLGRAARDQVTIDEETLEELRATIRTTQEEHAEKPWLFGPLEKLSDALLRAAFYLDDLVDLEDNEDDEVLDGDGKDYEPLWGAAEDDAASGGENAQSSGDELDHEGCGHEDCDHDHDEPEEVPGFPFVRESPKIGRNDPCPCGSGKKFKKCCG